MSAPFERRSPTARRAGTNGFLRLALRCAGNVHEATDRRMPEAHVLAVALPTSRGLTARRLSEEFRHVRPET